MEQKELINQEMKRLSLKSIVEKNNFKLIKKYLKGKIIPTESVYSSSTIDSNFIKENIDEILSKEYDQDYDDSIIMEIITKIKILEDAYEEYKVMESLASKGKIDKSNEEIYQNTKTSIFYSMIELRIALGLSLSKFDTEDIYDYCDALIFDLINHKYQRLSICDHVIEGCIIKEYKK